MDVCLSDSPSPEVSVATGVVARAPGGPANFDYSTTVSVPLERGRYLKLSALSRYSGDHESGLTEIEVLGY